MNLKNDYSFLFNSLNNNSNRSGFNNGNNIFNAIDLGEYYSIKSGNYGKLLKAYYTETDSKRVDSADDTDNKKDILKKDTEVEKLTEVKESASVLDTSAEKLITRGTDSLFREKEITVKDENGNDMTVMGYDTDAIHKAVKDFATNYNSFIKSMEDADSAKLNRELDNMTAVVSAYTQALKDVGIQVNKDNTLSIDENVLKAASVANVKKLFNGNASFAYKVSSRVSMMGASAESEANIRKNYNSAGRYQNALTTGNLMDQLI